MATAEEFQTGSLVAARGREWVVLPDTRDDILRLRPLGGSDEDATVIYLPLEPSRPAPATFEPPDPEKPGAQTPALLLRDALRLKLRAGAGPFRSFGNIAVEPRAYQLVPLLMALKHDTVRLLIADDVGIGKTIEAGLVVRELLDRGEIERLTVICPPHLCDQWQHELADKFSIHAEVVRSNTARRLECGLPAGHSIFDHHPFTIVSLDYIKSDHRRDEFLRACPECVVVDEAHTCVQANHTTRHQRYQLLKALAEAEPMRHMVLLTATPHSGDDAAFHNLLGLLNPKYSGLLGMREGEARNRLRAELANHFVQRRRADIREWNDDAKLPERESAEVTYALTGAWGALFDEVLAYAREMVRRAEGDTLVKQRMNWWAALALLRCVSSSPAAAALALQTRLRAVEDATEEQQIKVLEEKAIDTVMDGYSDDLLHVDETVPAGTSEHYEDAAALKGLIEKAGTLRGCKNDPKLAAVIGMVEQLLNDGYKPVVFCRYIATAHYVAEHLSGTLNSNKFHVLSITGELTPEQREARINALKSLEDEVTPVLVATDCLSEGINLQHSFDAVVHYDLVWNPTRHEQREGRVDRFGQATRVVRALMLYGENNPVDGAVLRVILRKAEKIRKELGVSVPLPADNNKVMEAIMQAVLLHGSGTATDMAQLALDFGEEEQEVETVWENAKEKERQSRTIFAQRRLNPGDVLPEWEKAVSVFGGEDDVERFVTNAATRLGAPLERRKDHFRFPVQHLPAPLRERLEGVGISRPTRMAFHHPIPSGCDHIHRAHPLVVTLADYVAERALAQDVPDLAARCGAVFTRDVEIKTTILLLRLRSQLMVEQRDDLNQWGAPRTLLAEECVALALAGTAEPAVMSDAQAFALMNAEPARNMEPQQQRRILQQAINALPTIQPTLDDIARARAETLLADHRRVREASDARGIRYRVMACTPADVIGVYVLNPVADI